MKIKLAGFNIDAELLKKSGIDNLTPETISAAYARISRDPRPIDELRADAITDITKARISNEQIVFGLGHASIAEHAVFNFDIMGVSRLAIEAIEHARLCSYTEKSQRYTSLNSDFIIPKEIIEAGFHSHFGELVINQISAYNALFDGIYNYMLSQNPKATKEEKKIIEGRAKEDARYVTSLAVEGQLGMTCNARNLEHMIRRLLRHPLFEVKQIGALLYEEAKKVAPSLLKYLEPTQEQLKAVLDLRNLIEEVAPKASPPSIPEVQLLIWDEKADNTVMAALIHAHSGLDMEHCTRCWRHMDFDQGNQFFKNIFEHLQPWDSLPRAFELADFTFELTISASCFAQLKRHRMATILPQAYNPILGYTIPPSIKEAGLTEMFEKVMVSSINMYEELVEQGLPLVAPYALTQAHRRRVIVRMNARELYHFSRLRQDKHAQWDIRKIANQMILMAKRECPYTMSLACGKDVFEEKKSKFISSWSQET